MSKTIEGVPESITRDDYVRLISSVGLDPELLIDIKFEAYGIKATVAAIMPDGFSSVWSPASGDEHAVATHEVFIPVIDDVTA